MEERVVLVDQHGTPIGTAEKLEAHKKGLLHEAFSIFVFNSEHKLLLQKRASSKYHSGGLWTNTCCSHPRPDEPLDVAVHRRLQEEMGFDCPLEHCFTFIYRASFANGLIEHERDHVFKGVYDGPVQPDPQEVEDYKWVSWDELLVDLEASPEAYSFWFTVIVKEKWEENKKGVLMF